MIVPLHQPTATTVSADGLITGHLVLRAGLSSSDDAVNADLSRYLTDQWTDPDGDTYPVGKILTMDLVNIPSGTVEEMAAAILARVPVVGVLHLYQDQFGLAVKGTTATPPRSDQVGRIYLSGAWGWRGETLVLEYIVQLAAPVTPPPAWARSAPAQKDTKP